MPFLRKWIYSGNVIEAAEYFSIRTPKSISWPEIGKRPLRGKNRQLTSEQQQKLNNRNAVNHCCRIMNCNFGPRDIFETLDLAFIPLLPDGEPDEDAVKKVILPKYTRKLRTVYRKAGVEFKYMYVIEVATEQGPVRMHIHMLLPKFSFDAVVECWTFGGCTIRRLDSTRDYKGIANYLSKDPTLGVDHKKRWGGSKNLVQPKIDCKTIQFPGGYIKAPKGYKAIIDRPYVSDVTGLSRYVRFVKMDGVDFSGQIMQSRAGPDPIPIEYVG